MHIHAQPLTQALIGPGDVHGFQIDPSHASGGVACHQRQLLRQSPVLGLGTLGAQQQPPGQRCREQHIEPAFEGLQACQPQGIAHQQGQQRIAQGHPDSPACKVQQGAPRSEFPRRRH